MTTEDASYPDHNDITWVTLAITHVEYPAGDIVGKGLACVSMLPLGLCVSMLTLVLFRRDLHTIFFFLGIVLNEIINFTLKHIIKEARPYKERKVLHVEYGMPSSHSQLIWFFATYLTLFMFIRLANGTKWSTLWKYFVTTIAIISATIVSYSRLYLLYHSFEQIVCGGLLGCFNGVMWFFLTHHIFTPWFSTITSWSISEFFMIRDTTLIPNVLWFEYMAQRTESRARQRKLRKSQYD